MPPYKPILERDPSRERLIELFNNSVPDDWVYDEETQAFALKAKPVLCVVKNEAGNLSLRYGYDEVLALSEGQMKHCS